MQKILIRNLLPSVLLLCFTSTSFSQKDSALKYAETITQSGLKKQLSVIASAEMEGRETGTEAQRKAAAYIIRQFKEIGLTSPQTINNFQQFYSIYKDTLVPKTFKIAGKKYDFGTDYFVVSDTDDNNEFKANNIIFGGYGIVDKNYDDYDGKDVKGKLVLIFNGEPRENGKYLIINNTIASPWQTDLTNKAIIAKQKGAAAILFIDQAEEKFSPTEIDDALKSNTNNHYEINSTNGKVTVIHIVPKILQSIFGEKISSEIIAAARDQKPLKDFNLITNKTIKLSYKKKRILSTASNVIGYIEGSDKKDEYVFITAHYDHLGKKGNVIYYGADDDGSGTASVIEMAAAFAKAKANGYGPKRTVVFMTVSGEEEGLWGSEYYASHPLFPLDSTSADLNTDMIGRIAPGRNYGDSTNYIYLIGNDKLSTDLKNLVTSVNDKYTKLELDYMYNDPGDPEKIFYRSDHYNFAKRGVPILFYFDGIHKDYHKPTDTIDKINFDLMEKRARYIFLTAWQIANRDRMLKRDLYLPIDK